MVTRHRLRRYSFERRRTGEVYLRIENGDIYAPIIDRAFPQMAHVPWYDTEGSATYTYIRGMETRDFNALKSFLTMLTQVIVIARSPHLEPYFGTELDECLALSYTFQEGRSDKRTPVHQLVYTIKYDPETDAAEKRSAAWDLLQYLVAAIRVHPILRTADAITCAPSRKRKRFHLAEYLAQGLCGELDGPQYVALTRARRTREIKNTGVDDKYTALRDAFTVDRSVENRVVLVVDDLYQSGMTMWTIAKMLKARGARAVYGAACVKTFRDTDNS